MNVEPIVSRGTRGGRGTLEQRVSVLERDMREVKRDIKGARENTETILSILTTAKGIAGFAQKHFPKVAYFIVGLMGAAGMGNPDVLSFIKQFFVLG